MSETEINEDNCVLGKKELKNIYTVFEHIKEIIVVKDSTTNPSNYLDKIFQKIKKLNDMAKKEQEHK